MTHFVTAVTHCAYLIGSKN